MQLARLESSVIFEKPLDDSGHRGRRNRGADGRTPRDGAERAATEEVTHAGRLDEQREHAGGRDAREHDRAAEAAGGQRLAELRADERGEADGARLRSRAR